MPCCGKPVIEFDESVALKPFAGEVFAERLMMVNGRKRNVVSWAPDPATSAFQNVRGIVLVSHGMHEHSLRYYGVAHEFTSRGYAVYGMDQIGHGKSEGDRGMIPDFNIMVDDYVNFAAMVRAEQAAGLPTFVVAHSMGTVVAILAVLKIPDVKAVVFTGCALFTGPASSSPFGVKMLYPLSQTSMAVSISRMMAAVDPKGPAAPVLLEAISSDEKARQQVWRDPRRVEGSVRNKSAYEFLKMVSAAKAALPSFTVPFYCMHGADDTIAYPKGSQFLVDKAGTDKGSKKVDVFPGLRHEVYHEREPEGRQCILKAVEYVEGILAGGVKVV